MHLTATNNNLSFPSSMHVTECAACCAVGLCQSCRCVGDFTFVAYPALYLEMYKDHFLTVYWWVQTNADASILSGNIGPDTVRQSVFGYNQKNN